MSFASLPVACTLLRCVLTITALPAAAAAQPAQPIGRFAVDARGALPVYPDDSLLSDPRGLLSSQLPGWGIGFDVGAHVYPLRWKAITFGVGASLLWTRRTRTQPTEEGATEPSGPDVTTKFTAFSPQVSFNFGRRTGFSYLSGGLGSSKISISRSDLEDEPGEAVRTINYGGGGRWFTSEHLAFTFDIRFYAMDPQLPTENTAGHPRLTLVVFTAGVSFK
jgi:hypothetical protein